MNKDRKTGYIALVLVSFFWGTTYIASKYGTRHMPGIFVAGVRQFISGSLMVGFFLLRGYKLPSWKEYKTIAVQGFFLLAVANGLLTWSLEYMNSGLAAIIAGLVPLFIALFSVWLSRSARVTRWMTVGLFTGFAGICIIFYDYIGQLANPSFILGIAFALISVLSWSFGTVYSSGQKRTIDILFNVGLQMLTAGVILLPICFITGRYVNLATIGTEGWYALAYLVVLGSFLGYSAYVVAINKLPPTQVSVYAYINPIVAVAFGWLLLGEKMNVHIILGTIVTIGGVYLVAREFKRQQAAKRIEIVDYEPTHQPYFEKFNRAWIEDYFTMEPVDEYVLRNPDEAILQPGGAILMAMYGDDVAGTAGLRKVRDDVYEFTKMAVDEKFRRRGIAEAISLASLEKAKQLGASEVILYSNTKNAAAIRLYEKLGFRHLEPEKGVYQRANVKMTINV